MDTNKVPATTSKCKRQENYGLVELEVSTRRLEDLVASLKNTYSQKAQSEAIDACKKCLALLKKCISAVQLDERRRANGHANGGIRLSDANKSALRTSEGLADRIAEIIFDWPADANRDEESLHRLFQDLLQITILVSYLSSQLLNTQKLCIVTISSLLVKFLESHKIELFKDLRCCLVSSDDLPAFLNNPDETIREVGSLLLAESNEGATGCNNNDNDDHDDDDQSCAITDDNGDASRDAESQLTETFSQRHLRLKVAAKRRERTTGEEPSKRRRLSNSKSGAKVSAPRKNKQRKKSSDKEKPVTEKKSALLFEIKVTIRKMEYKVRVSSIPVIRTSHAKQYIESWRTLFWDNAFSTAVKENEFTVPSTVKRKEFVAALLVWFNGRVTRQFQASQEKFLESCLPDEVTLQSLSVVNEKTNLRLPFWRWIYSCVTLIMKNVQVRNFWDHGWLNFISQKKACEVLKDDCLLGCSLIRFSTATCEGGLSVLRRLTDNQGVSKVNKYGVWKQEDFEKRSFFGSLVDCSLTIIINVEQRKTYQWPESLQFDVKSVNQEGLDVDNSDDEGEKVKRVFTQLHRLPSSYECDLFDIVSTFPGTSGAT